MNPQIRRAEPSDRPEWLRLRRSLWPDCPEEDHQKEITGYLAGGGQVVFVAVRPTGGLCGFVEASLRSQAEDCQSSPVGYVEGWYVDPHVRNQGIGGLLLAAAESWTVAQGCREMASDAELGNETSRKAHLGLGYEETSRLVHFRKPLPVTNSTRNALQPDARSLRLVTVPGRFAVCRLAPDEPVPA